MADPLALDSLSNFDESFGISSRSNVYLSPEQCWSVEHQMSIQNKNAFKNDVFTMGVILLQCGLLTSQRECYSME